MTHPPDLPLDLDEVAAEVGVHYQTVYRWVRAGKLTADMVSGRYLVRRDDLDAFLAARSTPTRPKAPGAARLARAADKMHAALISGDEIAARDLARAIVTERTPIADFIQEVLVPPLRRIGQDWHDGTLSIAVEHRASAITERLLGEVAPRPRGRKRGTVLVAAVSGDRHSLPTTMAAVTLRDNNWSVYHLGADMPPEELVQFCKDNHVDVTVLTLANPDCRDLAERTGATIEASGTPVIVGGPGRTLDELLERVRAAARTPRLSVG